jgi:hypothetical protein
VASETTGAAGIIALPRNALVGIDAAPFAAWSQYRNAPATDAAARESSDSSPAASGRRSDRTTASLGPSRIPSKTNEVDAITEQQ